MSKKTWTIFLTVCAICTITGCESLQQSASTPANLYIHTGTEGMTHGHQQQFLADLPAYTNDWQKLGLRGEVKSVMHFNARWVSYGMNTYLEFNTDGKLQLSISTLLQTESIIYCYLTGRLTKMTGRLSTYTDYNTSTRQMDYGSMEYDEQGLLTAHNYLIYNRKDRDTYCRRFEYDEQGSIRRSYIDTTSIRNDYYRENMTNFLQLHDYECDEKGRIIRLSHNFFQSPAVPSWLPRGITRASYTYDTRGKCIKSDEVFIPNERNNGIDSVKATYHYAWNKQGDLAEVNGEAICMPGGQRQTYHATNQYKYDEEGNWTQRTTKDREGFNIVTREITYFNE